MNTESKTQSIVLFVLFLLIVGGFVAWIMNQKPDDKALTDTSTLVFSPTPKGEFRPAGSEPLVTGWEAYTNSTYAFSMNIPEGWNTRDYAKVYAGDGTLIAFSPDELPCDTCSYFKNGYFSVRIFNDKTLTDAYRIYQERLQKVGKDDAFVGIQLGGVPGVAYQNTLAVEKNGWVYEFSLDKNEGKDKFSDSEIFMKVLSSFQFSNLLFGN